LPHLVDFDWRLDVKISSKQDERLKQPMLYVKMDLEDDTKASGPDARQEVLFQVSKGQLGEILSHFETINEQLAQIT
jgi:hypothetical protein